MIELGLIYKSAMVIVKKSLEDSSLNLKQGFRSDLVGLVVFYGTSTVIGNLMPNPIYRYIMYKI